MVSNPWSDLVGSDSEILVWIEASNVDDSNLGEGGGGSLNSSVSVYVTRQLIIEEMLDI